MREDYQAVLDEARLGKRIRAATSGAGDLDAALPGGAAPLAAL